MIKAGCGLIKDQYFARHLNRARDRDHLLDGDRIGGQWFGGINLQPVILQYRSGLGVHAFACNKTAAHGLPTQKQVFGHGQVGQQVDFLVYRADPQSLTVRGRGGFDLGSVQHDHTGVAPVSSCQAFDQCRFASAVLPQKRVHFSGHKAQFDIIQRDRAGEKLRYAPCM